eukprot:scaffold111786_cov63-Phaeocystis_antarctica.AAC.3
MLPLLASRGDIRRADPLAERVHRPSVARTRCRPVEECQGLWQSGGGLVEPCQRGVQPPCIRVELVPYDDARWRTVLARQRLVEAELQRDLAATRAARRRAARRRAAAAGRRLTPDP